MKLLLKRSPSLNGCTHGELFVDGSHECFTLEDEVREIPDRSVEKWKVPGYTAIPRGIYKIVIDFSNHFQKLLPHILDVPGFLGIRIHAGNSANDTEGCILVGRVQTPTSVLDSRLALDSLQAKIQAALDDKDEVTIEII